MSPELRPSASVDDLDRATTDGQKGHKERANVVRRPAVGEEAVAVVECDKTDEEVCGRGCEGQGAVVHAVAGADGGVVGAEDAGEGCVVGCRAVDAGGVIY